MYQVYRAYLLKIIILLSAFAVSFIFSCINQSAKAVDHLHDSISIEADEAIIDAQTNKIVYRGNVVITHPQVTIKGSVVELIDDNDAKRNFTARGDPVIVLWRHKSGTSTGSAMEIILTEDSNSQVLSMTGNATVRHQENQISGHIILYDFLTKKLIVSAKSPGSTAQNKPTSKKSDRVKIILKTKQ